jgi:hypothetical protein
MKLADWPPFWYCVFWTVFLCVAMFAAYWVIFLAVRKALQP